MCVSVLCVCVSVFKRDRMSVLGWGCLRKRSRMTSPSLCALAELCGQMGSVRVHLIKPKSISLSSLWRGGSEGKEKKNSVVLFLFFLN